MAVDRILVPTDGGVQATKAMEVALNMADEFDSETIHALFVVDSSIYADPALSITELLTDAVQESADDLMDEFRGRAEEIGVRLQTDVSHGRPKETIIERAEEIEADLIVMGSRADDMARGEGPICRYIARNAPCNVLVV